MRGTIWIPGTGLRSLWLQRPPTWSVLSSSHFIIKKVNKLVQVQLPQRPQVTDLVPLLWGQSHHLTYSFLCSPLSVSLSLSSPFLSVCLLYIFMCVYTGVYVHVEARGWRQVSSSITLNLIFETWSLTEPGTHPVALTTLGSSEGDPLSPLPQLWGWW